MELSSERILRKELEAAYAELQKVERSKDAFISILNHELRTPLTIAIAATEMLDGVADPNNEVHKITEMLRASLARESGVIDDLMLFSRLESAGLQIELREVEPEKMIRALVEDYRSVWEEKRLSLELVFDPALAPIAGDPELLRTAFKHLLLNAVRFNRNGGRVRIEAKNGPERLEILFSDTGIGIAPEQRAQVFDRFYQVAEHMTRRVGGLGLGLAIVRRIVEAHGGRVTVDARDGGGSEFRVSLPRKDLREN